MLETRANDAVEPLISHPLTHLMLGLREAALICDLDAGVLLAVNDEWCSVYGYSREEALQLELEDFCADPGGVEAVREGLRKGGGAFSMQRQHRRKDGSLFKVEVMASVATFDTRQLVFAIIRDLTETLSTEEQLRKSEERYRRLVEETRDMIVLFDIDGTPVYLNPAAAQFVGEKSTAVKDGHRVVRELLHPDSRPVHEAFWRCFRETGEIPTDSLELTFLVDEAPQHLENHYTVLRDEDGKPFGVQVVARNITERKEAALRSMELSEELERRVDERTAELLHMSEELDSFAYVFSHDLQGPIRAVSLNAGFVRTDLGPLLTPEIRGSLDRIEQSAIHTSQLIDGLLTLSRITRADLDVRDVDLSAIASEIVDQNISRSVGRAFDVRIDDGIICRADPMLAQKLLEHLIGNAFKFTGGCELSRIEFGAVRDAGETHYFVRDNGAGFEEAFASRLFTPFERLHDAGDFPGWGIGLATAKRIVSRHGGRIWAASEPGVGATFCFTLEA